MRLILPVLFAVLAWPVLTGWAKTVPVYPAGMKCGKISSYFGDTLDLDGTRRDVAHEGIDLGNLGDRVIAPANGTVLAIWAVHHTWGTDWNLLIHHTQDDLNMQKSGSFYVSEFDHLQKRNMPGLKPGDKIKAGQVLGRVGHPGKNPRFAPEVHLEVYRLPNGTWNKTTWHNADGIRYWWNDAADLIDPMWMLTRQNANRKSSTSNIQLFNGSPNAPKNVGFVYPLLCS